MRTLIISCITLTLSITESLKAGEGMWIPLLLEGKTHTQMQQKGLELTSDQIYSNTTPSLKDAIVLFGGRCTGSIVSADGLLLTNHHCGYSELQEHSTVCNDLLMDGYWARSREEELPNPGLTANFVIRMDDVTELVLASLHPNMDELERSLAIQNISSAIADSVTSGTHYTARVTPLFHGNKYMLHVYEVFRDVRLVGSPPSSVGKFGGDTDNWMWPRHTGDFAFFRIYADSSNKPARYSPSNIPYTPRHYIPISAKGVKPGDFTMVYGFPASTQRFIASQRVEHIMHSSNPLKVELRDTRLEIMDRHMLGNDTIRIKYASKHARISNAWKKWIGERNGLMKLNAVDRKLEQEQMFHSWAIADPIRKDEYGHILERFAELYPEYNRLTLANDLYNESLRGVELVRFISQFRHLTNAWDRSPQNDTLTNELQEWARSLTGSAQDFYRDYHRPIDKEIFAAMGEQFLGRTPEKEQPPTLLSLLAYHGGCWDMLAENLIGQSLFADSTRLMATLRAIDSLSIEQIKLDPLFSLVAEADSMYYMNVFYPRQRIERELTPLYRSYVKGILEMHPDSTFYPDANFTLRVSYGTVRGYSPRDGVEYHYATTLDGVMQKSRTGVRDYRIPEKLAQLYGDKNYGQWGSNGVQPLNFVASNHTSGGNSGSPVINSQGHLVGINFDRVWEGTMSDLMFDPERCRNISVDARYILFITQKFGGADYLLDEMKIEW